MSVRAALSGTRFRFWSVLGIIAAGWICLSLAPAPVIADDDDEENLVTGYARIEEDWSITIAAPDPNTGTPLIVTQMAPSMNSPVYCEFDVNFRSYPTFQKGGLEVQICKDGVNQSYTTYGTQQMSAPNEVISWTQYMQRDGTNLQYGISQGSSSTWGPFAIANLKVTAPDNKKNFNRYNSRFSVVNSGITYGANRVSTLTLVEVRKYRAGNLGIIPDAIEANPQTVYKITDLFPH